MAKAAKTQRVFFNKDDTALAVPNLIAHQKDSWREFIDTGLSEIFAELNPIEDYTGQKLELRFGSYKFQEPKHSEQDAKENNLTFDAPLHVMVELTNKVTGEVKEQEVVITLAVVGTADDDNVITYTLAESMVGVPTSIENASLFIDSPLFVCFVNTLVMFYYCIHVNR